ncbi:MAG: DUF3568 family protein [Isosphaeraceae bacterium]
MRQAGWIVLGGVLVGFLGCATVPPAADLLASSSSFSYAAGRGVQSFTASPAAVIAALDDSLADLKLIKLRHIRNGSVYRVEARTDDYRPIKATIRSHQGQTVVGIRAGWFGDEPMSRAILDRVAVRLGSKPPEAIPTEVPSAPAGNPFFSSHAVSDEEMFRDMAEAPYHDRVIP